MNIEKIDQLRPGQELTWFRFKANVSASVPVKFVKRCVHQRHKHEPWLIVQLNDGTVRRVIFENLSLANGAA